MICFYFPIGLGLRLLADRSTSSKTCWEHSSIKGQGDAGKPPRVLVTSVAISAGMHATFGSKRFWKSTETVEIWDSLLVSAKPCPRQSHCAFVTKSVIHPFTKSC